MLDSLINVKSRLGITESDNDAFLTQQIGLISDTIERYCRRKFTATNWKQTFYYGDTRDCRNIELRYYPVISLTSVAVDTVNISTSDFNNIIVHKPTGLLRAEYGSWFWGRAALIRYRAGYEVIPSPILSVLDDLVQQRYTKKTSGVDLNFGSDVQRVSIPGAISIDFDYSLSNNDRSSSYGTIIGSNANILDDWRSDRAVIGNGRLDFVEHDV